MSEYESLRTDLDLIHTSMVNYAAAVDRYAEVVNEQVAELWKDNAELRDELHALANRVETLTRARLTEPAEVAERMIFTCPVNEGCNLSRPHVHHEDGAVIYVRNADDARRYYGQREARDAILRGQS